MNNNDFKVYVIYKDGKPWSEGNKRGVYMTKRSANQVVSREAKYDARSICRKDDKYYFELADEERCMYVDKAKEHYEVKEFAESINKNSDDYKYYIKYITQYFKEGCEAEGYDYLWAFLKELGFNDIVKAVIGTEY